MALALSMGRSASSLSDHAPLGPVGLDRFVPRSGSLSTRRKISVPELSSTMSTVFEISIDSPTIPGRPPFRQKSAEAFSHERSNSLPGSSWRQGPFGDALVSGVTGPPVMDLPKVQEGHRADLKANSCSAIGSTKLQTTPPITSKPVLKLDTSTTKIVEEPETPPKVPPKSPSLERRASPAPIRFPMPAKMISSHPASAVTPSTAGASPLNIMLVGRRSPSVQPDQRGRSHARNQSETSIMDRGRPTKRTIHRTRSQTCSSVNSPDATETKDSWTLPTGIIAAEAETKLNKSDKENLRKQAYGQAERFEVLSQRDVNSLSRELRALDERCEYLRKTYKSLRSNRQKLHSRMISYLKRGETVIFSRESMLKQEEALAELDTSIDEFIVKLEQAENRRLRLRQKLLEHVAAALVLSPSPQSRPPLSESTPPRSPIKSDSPSRMERRDVESIKIYADGQVLNLFSDIERAIGQMCEAQC